MSLITASRISKHFGADHVLVDASLQLNTGERLCLVGPNGAGKTTLLRIILGEITADSGSVSLTPNLRIGVLDQHTSATFSGTVWETALGSREELIAARAEARALEDAWAANEHPTHEDLDRYNEVHERLRHLGDEAYDADVKATLTGLGLPEPTWAQATDTLSGGQRTRLALARLLLGGVDVLCLDEPTNHLDMEAVEWLEDWLGRFPGAALVISHDRYMMDAVATRVVELQDGNTRSYPGNYSAFVRLKTEERERQERLYSRQQEEITRLETYIERYRAGNRATMSKSRQKTLARIERIDKPREERGPNISFKAEVRSGDDVLRVRGLERGFNGRPVLTGVTFDVKRRERLGIIGPNGCGKTTLLKTIADELPPDAGDVRWGMNAEPAYFAQEMDMELYGDSPLDALMNAAPMTLADGRNLLARFGFRGDDVFRELEVLSGGERNRLQLAVLLARGANVLLLDEPTNHLDLPSRDALEEALTGFDGTLIFVSHDRYLLARLATRLLLVRDGTVTPFEGTYGEFREHQRRLNRPKSGKKSASTRGRKKVKPPDPAVIEREIAEAEKRLTELTAILSDPATYSDADTAPKATAEYERLSRLIPELYAQWETVLEEDG